MQIPFDQSMIVDFLLLCVAGYLVFSSVRRGCVPTFYSLLALCLSYPIDCYLFPLLASRFSPPVAVKYSQKFTSPTKLNGVTVVGSVLFYSPGKNVEFATLAMDQVA